MKRKLKIFVSVIFIIAAVLAVFVSLRLSNVEASIAYIPYNGGKYIDGESMYGRSPILDEYLLAENPEDMLGYYLISFEIRDTGFFVKREIKYKYDYEKLDDGLKRLYTVNGINTYDVLIVEDTHNSFHYVVLE